MDQGFPGSISLCPGGYCFLRPRPLLKISLKYDWPLEAGAACQRSIMKDARFYNSTRVAVYKKSYDFTGTNQVRTVIMCDI
jgi:hypothetical protein